MVKVNAMSYALMIKLLMSGDLTCKEIAEETGLHLVTIYQYTRELHKVGAIHIAQYLPDAYNRHTIKVYKLGKGKDAKHVRMTQAERQQRYRDKKNALLVNNVLAGKGGFEQAANGRLRYFDIGKVPIPSAA